ncbi:glycosyltransferase family 4 protein [Pseudoalteromonas sp. Ld20]|uniref:glycosyltransferase family 4 protein n=1 Tax=Pseudoalteromonas sp. Ld20 TaxID=649165 RepID=UPI0038646553
MKVAYLLELDLVNHLGVKKKVFSQVENLRRLGCEVEIFCITPSKESDDNVKVFNSINISGEFGITSQLFRYLNRILVVKKLRKALSDYSPELIYMREGVYYPGLNSILDKKNVVIEVNHVYGNIEKSKSKLLAFGFHFLRKKTLENASAFIAISNEVSTSLGKVFPSKPTIVISNGIAKINKLTKLTKLSNNKINILMVGSPNQPWQGYDQLLNFAEELEFSHPKIHFTIIGPSSSELVAKSQNVRFCGYLDEKDLTEHFISADIAIGTLAAYRKNINEVSSLKHRAYGSYGIPFITSVYDTDFSKLEEVLTIPNIDNSIIINKNIVIDFIISMAGKRIDRKSLEGITENNKSISRLSFFNSIVDRVGS